MRKEALGEVCKRFMVNSISERGALGAVSVREGGTW